MHFKEVFNTSNNKKLYYIDFMPVTEERYKKEIAEIRTCGKYNVLKRKKGKIVYTETEAGE